jgi:hypothetical protein
VRVATNANAASAIAVVTIAYDTGVKSWATCHISALKNTNVTKSSSNGSTRATSCVSVRSRRHTWRRPNSTIGSTPKYANTNASDTSPRFTSTSTAASPVERSNSSATTAGTTTNSASSATPMSSGRWNRGRCRTRFTRATAASTITAAPASAAACAQPVKRSPKTAVTTSTPNTSDRNGTVRVSTSSRAE